VHWALAVLFLSVLVCFNLQAQVQTAGISGTATDASGAVLAGAQIQATNQTTNASETALTDAQGRYRIADLPVGTYNVKATHSGFQTVVHKDVTLTVGSAIVMDFSLPVGKTTETVSVDAEVSRVETETSEISALIAPVQMRDLPINGRDFEKLIALTPGVATVPASANLGNFVVGRMYGAMDNYSVAGARPTGQAFLLDGTDIRDFWEHGTGSGYAGTSLGVEAIGEFQMLTSNYNAQFAGNGVVMNATSRSGTNDLHGGFYEYLRNSALDSTALSDRNAGLTAPPPFKRNQFGAAVGGPIKKDKAFFFANYESLIERLQSTIGSVDMPMPYLLQGELPCTDLAFGYTGCPASPSNTPGNSLGTNPIVKVQPFGGAAASPLAIANLQQMTNIMKLYQLCATCAVLPSAATSAMDQGGYYKTSETFPTNTNESYVMGRFDYTLGAKDSLFARYTLDNASVDDPRDPMEIFPETDHTRNQFLTVTERRTLSTTAVNTFHLGYTRSKEASATPFQLTSAQLSKVGLSSDPLDLVAGNSASPAYADAAIRPDAQLSPWVSLGIGAFPALGPDPDRPQTVIQTKYSAGNDLLWTSGAHSIALGVLVQRVMTNNYQLAYAAGQTPNLWTPNDNGLGMLQGFFEARPTFGFFVPPGNSSSNRFFRENGVAPYIQDNWKISPRLTINLGLRLDYFTNPTGYADNGAPLTAVLGSFLAPTGPLAVAPNCTAPGASGTSAQNLAYAECQLGIFSNTKHTFANDPNAQNWEPRVGFAYDPFGNHQTSIRGGFGIFHDPVSARIYQSGYTGTPPAAAFEPNNFTPAILSALGIIPGPTTSGSPCFPNPFAVVAGYCGIVNPTPAAFAAVDYQMSSGSPYMMQYNLNVQRQLPANMLLSVGYVGSLGRHMWMQRDTNPLKCSTYPNCSGIPTAADPNSGACFSASCAPGFTPTLINPDFGQRITEATTTASSYSSLQASLSHQFSKALSGQVNYTWSHCIDNGSFATSVENWGQLMTDPYNQTYDYGNCTFDIRHNLSGNGVYTLPFQGNRLVKGWQLSTILSFNTGMPINVYNNSPQSDPSGLNEQWATRPNYTFAAGCSPNQLVKKWVNTNPIGAPYWTYEWFSSSCYTPQSSGYFGDVARNSIPGPHFFNADFSIIKNTKLTERLNAQFRAEFFNVLNHFNIAAPNAALGNNLYTVNSTTGAVTPGSTVPTGYSGAQQGQPRQIQFAVKFDF
jgi:hypothetical protein